MRVIVEMEIETTDYGGREFMEEIEKLLTDIDSSGQTQLERFKMFRKDNKSDARNIDVVSIL